MRRIWDGHPPITDPTRPPAERLQTLEALAMGLSPMHPKMWEWIKKEHDAVSLLLPPDPPEDPPRHLTIVTSEDP